MIETHLMVQLKHIHGSTSFANVTAGTGDLVFKTGETEFVDLQGGTASYGRWINCN